MTFLAAHAPDGLLAPGGLLGTSHRLLFKISGRNTIRSGPFPGRLSKLAIDILHVLRGTRIRSRICDQSYEYQGLMHPALPHRTRMPRQGPDVQEVDFIPAIRMVSERNPTRHPAPWAKRPARRLASRNERRIHVCLVRSDLRENPNQTSSQESKRHKEIQRED